MNIPITVGVTGHRDLRKEDLPILRTLVYRELEKIKKQCPDSTLIMLNSIASGADSLCAQEALKLGYRLHCPLPVDKDIYRLDFSGEDAEVFDGLLARAEKVFTVPGCDANKERSFRFRRAGEYVASHCHVLLALWDGSEAKPNGCGTAETVAYMLTQSSRENPFADCGAVIHVHTPRLSGTEGFTPAVRLIESEPGWLDRLLTSTDTFNMDGKQITRKDRPLLRSEGKSETVTELEKCNAQAAALSSHFQKKYLWAMRLLSSFCVLLVMSYLIYDEAELILMLPFYGVVLMLYYFLFRKILHGRYHEKYLSYRMLAESLRVQTYMCALNIPVNVGEYYTWTQKQETVWIKYAIKVIDNGMLCSDIPVNTVNIAWLDGQLDYHRKAYKKNHGKDLRTEKISHGLIRSTVVLFVIVLVLECFFSEVMQLRWLNIGIQSWMKIVWGTISAAALFVSEYYGNLSFERKLEDNLKMAELFDKAARDGISSREAYISLAREEIIENGNWASYCRENRLMFNL